MVVKVCDTFILIGSKIKNNNKRRERNNKRREKKTKSKKKNYELTNICRPT